MPLTYWDEAFRTSVFLTNRLPKPVLANQSPFESLYSVKPNYSILKVFGCLCFPNRKPFNPHKLAFRFIQCTFIRYRLNHKGYKCLDSNGKVYMSHDVLFHEASFPFATITTKDTIDYSLFSSIVQLVVSIHVIPTPSLD